MPADIQRGSGQFTTPPPPPPAPPVRATPGPGEPRLDIRFDRAPLAMVVQSLLGDTAGASVVIAPDVTGEITIQSQGQLVAADIPNFLRDALKPLGVEIVQQGPNAYFVRRMEAVNPSGAQTPSVYQPGMQIRSGVVILGLRYVSATEMVRLLQPFLKGGATVQPETTREMLVISGPQDAVRVVVETVQLFDVDWLKGMSFGVVPLQYSDPASVIEDLKKLFGGANGPIGTMVDFVPLRSTNAVLILAKRPDRLDEARNWILQLDRPSRIGGSIQLLPLRNTSATELAETIKSLFEGRTGVKVTADTTHNALLVQGDAAAVADIRALVEGLDAPIPQVVIEVTIVEVTLNNDFRFGVQWSFNDQSGNAAALTQGASSTPTLEFPGLAYSYTGMNVQATLNALASKTNVEVLSKPIIVTQNNKEATLQIGDQVPIVTQQTANVTTPQASVINTVQYRDTGVLLRVTPRIGAGDVVTLQVNQEASEVSATTTSGIDSPTIQQRRFQSTVAVPSGGTVVLGGLIRATRTRNSAGLPLLSEIPLVGGLFGDTNNTVRRTELLIILTPRIIRSPDETAEVTDDLRERLSRIRDSRFINGIDAPR
ncbi:MAG: secretin N-terminal domain-containing protein [Caulobacteraceae bacterium]